MDEPWCLWTTSLCWMNLSPRHFLVAWGFPFASSGQSWSYQLPHSVIHFPDCLHLGPADRIMQKGAGIHSACLGPEHLCFEKKVPLWILALASCHCSLPTTAKGLLKSRDQRYWLLGVPFPLLEPVLRGCLLKRSFSLWVAVMGSGFQAALHSVWRLLAGRQWQCRLSSTHLLLFIFQSLHRALHALGLGFMLSSVEET